MRILINIEIIIIVLVVVPFLEFTMSLRSKHGRTQVDYDLTPIYFSPSGIVTRNTRTRVKIASRMESDTPREERNLWLLTLRLCSLRAWWSSHALTHFARSTIPEQIEGLFVVTNGQLKSVSVVLTFFSFLIAARNHSFLIHGEVSEVLLSASQVPL